MNEKGMVMGGQTICLLYNDVQHFLYYIGWYINVYYVPLVKVHGTQMYKKIVVSNG